MKIGDRLGRYEILDLLGAGGMGEVYRARDTRLDRDVAVKVLPEHLVGSPEALARFEREAKAVAALSHPNILALYDIGTEQSVHYTVTELLEGETLRDRLARSALSWRKAVEIGAAVAEGLSAAHSKGIIHRDLKPGNLFLTSDGRVKILDFGLARYQPSVLSPGEAPTESLPGALLGTVGYMSPEQIRGLPAGTASDFSLGCVLYEMATGTRAFHRAATGDTLASTLHDEPPPVAASGREVPAELERLIGRCLEKNPGERIQSPHDLAISLRDTITERPRPAPGPRGNLGSRRAWQ